VHYGGDPYVVSLNKMLPFAYFIFKYLSVFSHLYQSLILTYAHILFLNDSFDPIHFVKIQIYLTKFINILAGRNSEDPGHKLKTVRLGFLK
jgi:hypothetical protein